MPTVYAASFATFQEYEESVDELGQLVLSGVDMNGNAFWQALSFVTPGMLTYDDTNQNFYCVRRIEDLSPEMYLVKFIKAIV